MTGDTQCAEITIPDDSYPQGERRFNVSIGEGAGTVGNGGDSDGGNGGGGGGGGGRGEDGGVKTNSDLSSVTVDIGLDINDGELYVCNYCITMSDLTACSCADHVLVEVLEHS